MSTSLLYHGFGVRGYEYASARYIEGEIHFHLRQDIKSLRCRDCGAREVIRKGSILRRFRGLPIGGKPVWIFLAVQRVLCLSCGSLRQVEVGFADTRRSYSRRFERYVLELCRRMTIKDVARHLMVSWDMVKGIQKRHLERRFSKPKLRKLRRIAIDEISIKKGHKYLTIVLDLLTGAVVFVGDGKGAGALEPFFQRLKRSRAKVEAVAMDMSPAYIEAVLNNLDKAVIVFDHFHVIKLFNEKLSDLRRKLYHELTSKLKKKVLKGTRWLLLKNPGKLDASKNEPQRLEEALRLNQPLAAAYYMKEDLRQIWLQVSKSKAKAVFKDWIARAQASGISMLIKFANTMAAHRTGILAFYDHPISTGPLEGTNNKIKTMKRQAYGYRDMDFFKLKILALHETRYALVG